jgi:RHS repeat-associated protein
MHFSNTVTVEQNVLGAGVVGHILRNRSINKLTGATADRWFHYDQVGSVISESDASGLMAQAHHQDAFGNTQAAWNTGLWGGDKPGWHHNTKEYDGDTGLVYMYQRWYSAETGTFMTSAPYPVMMEHRYGFAENQPESMIDPNGQGPIGAFNCWRLTRKMAKYIDECEKELECLINEHGDAEGTYIFIDKYTTSGGFGAAMLKCVIAKGQKAGDAGLVARWMAACGLHLSPPRPR